jgi:ATP-binding cassette subfamily B protein
MPSTSHKPPPEAAKSGKPAVTSDNGTGAATPSASLGSAEREAITFYRPMEDREADRAPLSAQLIRRIFAYTQRYRSHRNWLFILTLMRGLQLPALAWMIGQTINGPIAGKDLPRIFLYSGLYFALAVAMVITLHFRQRLALQLGEAIAHDMRLELFRKLNSMPLSFFNKTKFGRIISRMTSDIDANGRRCGAHGLVQLEAVFDHASVCSDYLADQ